MYVIDRQKNRVHVDALIHLIPCSRDTDRRLLPSPGVHYDYYRRGGEQIFNCELCDEPGRGYLTLFPEGTAEAPFGGLCLVSPDAALASYGPGESHVSREAALAAIADPQS